MDECAWVNIQDIMSEGHKLPIQPPSQSPGGWADVQGGWNLQPPEAVKTFPKKMKLLEETQTIGLA